MRVHTRKSARHAGTHPQDRASCISRPRAFHYVPHKGPICAFGKRRVSCRFLTLACFIRDAGTHPELSSSCGYTPASQIVMRRHAYKSDRHASTHPQVRSSDGPSNTKGQESSDKKHLSIGPGRRKRPRPKQAFNQKPYCIMSPSCSVPL